MADEYLSGILGTKSVTTRSYEGRWLLGCYVVTFVSMSGLHTLHHLVQNVYGCAGTGIGIGVLGAVLAAQTLYVGTFIPGAPPNYQDVSREFSVLSGAIRWAGL